jgi:hypothetical protein
MFSTVPVNAAAAIPAAAHGVPGVEQEQASSLGASNAINGMARRIRIIEILG